MQNLEVFDDQTYTDTVQNTPVFCCFLANSLHGNDYSAGWEAATLDFEVFGRPKSLTYVIVYGPDEDKGEDRKDEKLASIDFWSGITQRWHK